MVAKVLSRFWEWPLPWSLHGQLLSVPLVSVDSVEKTRLPIPVGLADMPPGPELAAALAGIDLSRLGGLDCVTVMRAQHRQAAHEQARLMAAMVEVARCGVGPDDALPRMDAPDEFSADEIRGALVWTRAAANTQLSLAWDLCSRLAGVFATLERGGIDVPKAKVFSEWTSGLTDEQALEVCDVLLPEAPELTTGQLTERIKKLAIAIDPDWARRRYAEAVRDRKVVGYRNEDGSANLCGYQLPADGVAAACANLDALAKKIKRSGDGRPIDQVRADLYLAMLDGSYTGWAEHDIIAHVVATTEAIAAEQPGDQGRCTRPGAETSTRRGGQDANDAETVPPHDPAQGSESARSTVRPDLNGGIVDDVEDRCARPARRAGVEIRVELTTVLGWDDHPGELPGSGPVHADVARRLVREQTAAEWRYAITDDDGRLVYEGISRHRPAGFPLRSAAPARGGIVELQVRLSALRQLAARPARLGGWMKVVADLARQANQHEQADRHEQAHHDDARHAQRHGDGRPDDTASPDLRASGGGDERGPRRPGKPMRRRTEIRDRTCTNPRCRTPANGTDGDHIQEWARGGATREGNIGSACRHDHRLRHEGGWRVVKLPSGQLVWISRLGVHYRVPPPLIIQPLPDPVPRESSPSYQLDDQEDVPIWREPAASPAGPGRSPPLDPHEPVPF
jgi:hypothetical protein